MTEQHRQAAWEAIHRPETTPEELTRIGASYPEFADAAALHPNALSPSVAQKGKLNVFGIAALSVLVVHAIWGSFMPSVVSRAAMTFNIDLSHLALLSGAITLAWVLVAGTLALVGVLKKDATRMRWTATSSLVVCALSVLSLLTSLFIGLFASAMY